MPSHSELEDWIRRNEDARAADRAADLERSMSERLEDTVRLSVLASELHESMASRDVRSG